jgi:hypothetical protein
VQQLRLRVEEDEPSEVNGRVGLSNAGLWNAWLYRARPIALIARMSSRPLRTNAGIPLIASSSRWMLGRTSWAVAFRGRGGVLGADAAFARSNKYARSESSSCSAATSESKTASDTPPRLPRSNLV